MSGKMHSKPQLDMTELSFNRGGLLIEVKGMVKPQLDMTK